MVQRKIIQIAMTSQAPYTLDEEHDLEREVVISALCNDGTAWLIRPDAGSQAVWERLPPIPQD